MVAMVRASPRNRSAKPGSSSSEGSRILTATVRPSTSSVPRQTSPMPPPAIRSSSLYRPPSTVPGLTIATTCMSIRPLVGDRGLHDVAADPGRLRAAAYPRVLQEDRDRDDRLAILERESNEPPVYVARLIIRCRSGSPADVVPVDLGLLAGAVLLHALHHLLESGGRLRADRRTQGLRPGGVDDVEVGRLALGHQVRLHLDAAVGHGRGDH